MELAAAMTVEVLVVFFFEEEACEASEDERDADAVALRAAWPRDLQEAQNQPLPSASASAAER